MERTFDVWNNCTLEYDDTTVNMVSEDGSNHFSLILRDIHDVSRDLSSTIRTTVTNEGFFENTHHVSLINMSINPTNQGEEFKISFVDKNNKSTGNIMFNNLEEDVLVEWMYRDEFKVDSGTHSFPKNHLKYKYSE